MEDEIFYLCDPHKNAECRKTGCYLNALCRFSEKNRCRMTNNPDYAKTDEKGEKIILLRKYYSGDGDSYFYEDMEMAKKIAMERQLQSEMTIEIDGKKVAELIKASVERANRDNTRGV